MLCGLGGFARGLPYAHQRRVAPIFRAVYRELRSPGDNENAVMNAQTLDESQFSGQEMAPKCRAVVAWASCP